MQGKKDSKADHKRILQNLEPSIAQFPVRIGAYWEVLLDYFRICPHVQNLEINWKKISQEYPKQPPHEAVPRWVCSKYNTCEHNEHCRPPFRWSDTEHKYEAITNQDYVSYESEVGPDGKVRKIPKSTIGQFIINHNKKVLASPERLRSTREKCRYVQDQVANMCGLTKQALSLHESILTEPKDSSQDLTRVALDNQMRQIMYSLCCLLAILYEVTPGYLLGQSDDPERDIYVNRHTYYKKSDLYYEELVDGEIEVKKRSVPEMNEKEIEPECEEYEVSPSAYIPIVSFSNAKYKGRLAANRMREQYDSLDPSLLRLINACEPFYYRPIPQDLRLFLEGLLDDTNTVADQSDVGNVAQSEKT